MYTSGLLRMKKAITDILKSIPALLWMAAIYLYSDAPAVRSTAQSITVTERLLNLISGFIVIDEQRRIYLTGTLEPYIRKLAHMTEYGILFFLLLIPLSSVIGAEAGRKKFTVVLASYVSCFVYACSDEFHQLFVFGRSGSFRDVLIDMAGVTVAALVYLLCLSVKTAADRKRDGNI